MSELIRKKYEESQSVQDIVREKNREKFGALSITGLSGSLSSCIISAVHNLERHPTVIVLPEKEEAAYVYNDIQQLLNKEKVLFFPASGQRLVQGEGREINTLDRTLVLKALSRPNFNAIIITYSDAVMELTTVKSEVRDMSIELKQGEEMIMDLLVEELNERKFERSDFVYKPGQFSWRGGIIDVFSFTSEMPFRLEFNGDTIESIRRFDIQDQLSINSLREVSITPDVAKLEHSSEVIFFENLPQSSCIWIKDMPLLLDKLNLIHDHAEGKEVKVAHASPEKVIGAFNSFTTIQYGNHFKADDSIEMTINSTPQPSFNKQFELLAENLRDFKNKGYDNFISASDSNQVNRFYQIFEDIGQDVHISPVISNLHEGFIDHSNKHLIYTDHQLFGRYHKFRLRESFGQKSDNLSLKELKGLQAGDFITHIDHGVGRYSGLEKIDVNGKMQEAIRIIYKNHDVLYVSIHSLHRISKYIGKDGSEPQLAKLGSNAWKTLKQKTKSKVKELAFDLIKLYAERKAKKGFAFSPDSYLQTELEASFIYEDTPDQFKATNDVKKDMEEPHPMDRLVCGDVGFGKTEVAIRAAFKAVNDSKQVAILVPTTILAMQHYKTFKTRLEPFPCKVEYLNRFRSAAEQRRIIEELKEGKVDILIGTHKILSDKVKFKDLGLMVIDEEQKFGVGSKDKLKSIKVNVDSLTLTATPIPRTLQFSMMGARDLSVINTAPPNRQAIETRLFEFSEHIIKEAIEYEVSRNGQVFFIHNRVQNIGEVGAMLSRLCPGVRVLVAHGQMKGSELEKKMVDFIDGEFDVLVSTTIVESGLDIPNANTIIINQANNFGLSDLHQMRGRVGRSNKKAFCYLLAPAPSVLTALARKRLKAIEQFSQLGSGFQIAMRDLDIRGAGNLLGGEQSGFITEMGFDMYQKILNEAIQELKESEFKESFADDENKIYVSDCQVETDFEVLIPDDYVTNIDERLSLYRELDDIEDSQGLEKFKTAMEDRFGLIPKQVSDLFDIIKLRWTAKRTGLEKIVLKNSKMICYFISNPDSMYFQSADFQSVLRFVQQNPNLCRMVERKERLSLAFEHVTAIFEAREIISGILPKKVENALQD
ncbi:MAG: transcription-repair coupling factor [Vicingaceae bacterium]